MSKQLLSLAQLSRKLDVPYSRLHRLALAGKLRPDATSDRFVFFKENRLPAIAELIDAELAERNQPTLPKIQ